MRLILLVVSLLASAIALVAPAFGYHAVAAAAWSWIFLALVSTAAIRLVTFFPWGGAPDAILRMTIIGFAIVTAAGLVLGAAGWIGRGPYVASFGAILGVAVVSTRGRPFGRQPAGALPIAAVGFAAALVIFIAAYGLSQSPLTAYDSLSYHLYFPGRWLQDHRISIIPTPFSDEAQAYAPGNGELYFLWLMLPVHGDLLARVGQLPFYLLIGVTLFALARRLGARAEHAVYAALFCLVARPMVEQAVGADVDLICWSLFMAAIFLGLVAAERDTRRDWVLWGVAVGLYAGTKYVALVYLPVVILLALIRGLKPRMVWAVPGLLAFAAPWYLRNWILAGSPLYPASLQVAGVTLAHGAYSRAAMLHSVFHTTDLRLFPVMAAHAFGPTLMICWLPFVLVGGWRLARPGASQLGRWLLAAPILMSLLYWVGVPDNVDSRFLLPAIMLAQLPLAFAFGSVRRWNAAVHGLYAAAMLWIVIGIDAEIPAQLPWFMGGWLRLWGLVGPTYLTTFFAVAAVMAAVGLVVRRLPGQAAVLAAATLAGAVILARGALAWCGPARCEYLQTTSIFLRSSFLDAWRWSDAHLADATIAYAGNNVPYPLMGSRLVNRVLYVNIDRHEDWRFHDYARAAARRRTPPPGPVLATSSGVLRSLADASGPVDAVRPRFERLTGDREAWVHNLTAKRADYVFVSALSAYEIDNNWHNEGGFPIEDEWARADPNSFTVVYENPQVRIYSVVQPKRRP